MGRAGAKSKYDTCVKPYLKEINEKVRQGVIEAEIAKSLGISVASLNNYKNQHAELREALSKDKGAEVLQGLINAGIRAATGYFEENVKTTILLDDNGKPLKKQREINKIWYPPNPVLNRFYVTNFGKDQGFTGDPLEYELRKAKHELDEAERREKNWDAYIDDPDQ